MPDEYPLPDDGREMRGGPGTAVLGCIVGLIAGFFLFVSTYPFLGTSTTPVWQISLFDGIVIIAVGGFAYFFRKRSSFLAGVVVSAALLSIVNGLCGISTR